MQYVASIKMKSRANYREKSHNCTVSNGTECILTRQLPFNPEISANGVRRNRGQLRSLKIKRHLFAFVGWF